MFTRSISRRCAAAPTALGAIVRGLVAHPDKDEVLNFLSRVKTTEELVAGIAMVNHIVASSALHDSIGDRQDLFHRICEAAYQCRDCNHMWAMMKRCRSQGMILIRPHAYSVINAMRRSMEGRFEREGRNPEIIQITYARLRQFIQYCEEDGMLLDYMLWNRVLILMLHLMSLFDRQLLYRDKWNYAVMKKREGLFVDYVITHERVVDYDFAVEETLRLLDEITTIIRKAIPTRPSFAFMYRVVELAFACDDFERMYSAMEDMRGMGMFYSESLSARLVQLAIGFNIPTSMEIFVDWRVFHDNSKLNAYDFFRVLAFYCRSGGGKPCPKCGDAFNHRNVSLAYWASHTPPAVKACEYLALARTSKGLYNDILEIPQNNDWSTQAIGVLKMAQEKGISFTTGEWRLFILCCTFSPRAYEALGLMEAVIPQKEWDDILMATVVRLHRFNDPTRVVTTLRAHKDLGRFLHNLGLNEALMGVCYVTDPQTREEHLSEIIQLMQVTGTAPHAIPLQVVSGLLNKRCMDKTATERETSIISELSHWVARASAKLKRSFWETVPGTTPRHRQTPSPPHVDVVVLCGSAVLPCIAHAVRLYRAHTATRFLITGGIGHSTKFLYEAVAGGDGRTEADVIADVVRNMWHGVVDPSTLLLETRSTNCGENAQFSVALLKEGVSGMSSVVVVQDPTMQRRTHLSFTKAFRDHGMPSVAVYSGAPTTVPDPRLWRGEERMLQLMLGEVPRLINYGSPALGGKGLGFIDDCHVPGDVMEAHAALSAKYPALAAR